MKAPKRIDVMAARFVVQDGKRTYSQLSDDMLDALEADVRESHWTGPGSVGMLVARLRESEADRDVLFEAIGVIRDADDDCGKDGLPHNLPPHIRKMVDAALKKVTG